MPSISYRDADDPEIAELVRTIRARRSTGKLLNLDRMLLHSPPFAKGWNSMFAAIRNELQVPRHVNELAICAVARLNRADYEWIQHAPEFLAAGGTQQQLDALDDVTAACYDTRALRRRRARGIAPDARHDARDPGASRDHRAGQVAARRAAAGRTHRHHRRLQHGVALPGRARHRRCGGVSRPTPPPAPAPAGCRSGRRRSPGWRVPA